MKNINTAFNKDLVLQTNIHKKSKVIKRY